MAEILGFEPVYLWFSRETADSAYVHQAMVLSFLRGIRKEADNVF